MIRERTLGLHQINCFETFACLAGGQLPITKPTMEKLKMPAISYIPDGTLICIINYYLLTEFAFRTVRY